MLHRLLFQDPFFQAFPRSPRSRMRSHTRRVARPRGPALDVFAKDNEVLVRAELPGVASDALALDVHGDTLTLRGHFAAPDEAEPLHRERAAGEFVRTLQLPFAVDADGVQAKLKLGVLEVRLIRPEEDRPRRIEISSDD